MEMYAYLIKHPLVGTIIGIVAADTVEAAEKISNEWWGSAATYTELDRFQLAAMTRDGGVPVFLARE